MPAPHLLGVQPLPVHDFEILLKGHLADLETKLVKQYGCTFTAWKDENIRLKDYIFNSTDWLQEQPVDGSNGAVSAAGVAQDLRELSWMASTTQQPAYPCRKFGRGINHLRPPQDTSDVEDLPDDPQVFPSSALTTVQEEASFQPLASDAFQPQASAGSIMSSIMSRSRFGTASNRLGTGSKALGTGSRALGTGSIGLGTSSRRLDAATASIGLHSHASWQSDKSILGLREQPAQVADEENEEYQLSQMGYSESWFSEGPEQGPQGLEVSAIWHSESEDHRRNFFQVTSLVHYVEDDCPMVGARSTGRVGDKIQERGCLQALIISPDGRLRLCWAILGALLLSWDVLVIPLLAFDLTESRFTDIMGMVAACYWTLDLVMQFFIGYHIQGAIEMRPRFIVQRYLRTWFAPDFIITVLDWCYLGFSYGGGTRVMRMGRSVRVMRLLRVVRLIRFLKIARMLKGIVENMHSEYINLFMKLARLVIFILVLNHYVACCWYGLAHFNDSDERTWVKENRLENERFLLRYSTALHWSLTQFTPATNNIVPVNGRERVFASTVVIFALITFSTFVSSITTSMQQLWNLSAERMKEEEKIRSYLSQKRVSMLLGNKVWQSWKQNLQHKKEAMLERDITFFADMPESLRQQLHKEVRMPLITMHPFYHQFEVFDLVAMVNLCHIAVAEESFNTTMDVFLEGKAATHVRYVVSGTLQYSCRWLHEATTVEVASWLSECALWAKWTHRGRLGTLSHCEMLQLDLQKMLDIVCQREQAFSCLKVYASRFVEYYEEKVATDLSLDFDVLQEFAQTAFSEAHEEDDMSPRKSADFGNRNSTNGLRRSKADSAARKSLRSTRSSPSRSGTLRKSLSSHGSGLVGSIKKMSRSLRSSGRVLG